MVDIYHSRRTKYKKCLYYIRNEDDFVGDLSKWVLQTKVAGEFYAQPVYSKSHQANQLNNVLMFDKNNITLLTNDDVENLTRGCVVLYEGHPWMVDSLQQELHLKESEFGHNHYDTYISLRR